MAAQLKKVSEQVLVITGASSGIGLTTAKMAAERGARVVLAARDEEGLRQAVEEIRGAGGEAVYVVADVADPEEVQKIADTAIQTFGGFDTWVNNAGISIYGRALEIPTDEAHRLFETNYWGMVNGCKAAVPHLRHKGGVLINVGSVVSDRAVPLQSHYSASKHAVKGFTDSLRMELEEEGLPVAVTLIKPAAINTPFPEHAQSYLENEPTLPAPVYAPEEAARGILACAEKPRRELFIGGGGRMMSALEHVTPRLGDRYMEATMFEAQQSNRPALPNRPSALYRPMPGSGREHGNYEGHVMRSSLYTRAALHPGVVVVLALAGIWAALSMRQAY